MALIECRFFSTTLQLACSMNVILPEPASAKRPLQGWPVLYLLHGLSDDHSAWCRRSAIERHVEGRGLAVVMPAAGRSFYADMASGAPYWQFISEELPMLAQSFFPLSAKRADTFVAGLSMGGYGAFKLALCHPERFAAAASFSGALDLGRLARVEEVTGTGDLAQIFGAAESISGSGNDLFALAERLARADTARPRLFQSCGSDDFLYADNRRFAAHIEALGLAPEVHFGPGDHDWAYWDATIQTALDWMLPPHKATPPASR